MHLCCLSLYYEGVLVISRLVISLFPWCLTFYKECKLCSTGEMIQWSWWIVWFPDIFSTLFALSTHTFKSSGLITCLECTSDLNVTYRYVCCACLHPWNNSFQIPLQWPIHIINPGQLIKPYLENYLERQDSVRLLSFAVIGLNTILYCTMALLVI